MAAVIAFLNVILLCFLLKRSWDRKFEMMIFFCAGSLFFSAVPLLFDCTYLSLGTFDSLVMFLDKYNKMGEYSVLVGGQCILDAALFLFLFNLILALSVYGGNALLQGRQTRRHVPMAEEEKYFPPILYITFAYAGLLFFFLAYGFRLDSAGFGYRSTAVHQWPLASILSQAFLAFSLPGLNMVQSKRTLRYLAIGLPFAILAFFTGSRQLFIAAPVTILYYYLRRGNFQWRNIVGGLFLLYFFVALMRYVRTYDWAIMPYPVWRDSASSSCYYVFDNIQRLFTDFDGIHNLIITGLPIPRSENYRDLCAILADSMHGRNWGTMHPSLYGWVFMDARWAGLLYAVLFGVFFAVVEKLVMRMPQRSRELCLGLQISFLLVLLRGSVQVAYSNFLYAFIFMLLSTYYMMNFVNPRRIS